MPAKFIPYDKLSKAEQHKRNKAKRTTWAGLSPVTRVKASKKVYDRNRVKQENRKEPP